MQADQDFDLEQELPPLAGDLIRDLELGTLLSGMAAGDKFLLDIAQKAVLASLTDTEAIEYRQHVLADCLAQPSVVREIYDIAVEAVVREKREYFGLFRDSPDTILHRSVRVLEMFVSMLRKLRAVADEHAGDFRSEGFTRFFTMLSKELGDEYFSEVEDHLRELKFRHGILISAGVGTGNKGINYVLRRLREQRWIERISPGGRAAGYSFQNAVSRTSSGYCRADPAAPTETVRTRFLRNGMGAFAETFCPMCRYEKRGSNEDTGAPLGLGRAPPERSAGTWDRPWRACACWRTDDRASGGE